MKNIYNLTRVFRDDSLGVTDEQLLSKIKFLKKSHANWMEWAKEVSNTNINNEEAIMLVLASKGSNLNTNLQILKAYIKRGDTDFAKTFKVMTETKQLCLWKMIPTTLKEKAELFLRGKTPDEKIELAKSFKIAPFWNLILSEDDVEKMILSLPIEKAVSYPEEMGYNGLWNLIFRNPHISKLMMTA